MRSIILFILITAFGFATFAQRSPVDKLIKKYDWNKGLTIKEINPGSTEFTADMKLEGDEVKKAIASIDKINIINGDSASCSPDQRADFYEKAVNALSHKNYETMLQVRTDDGENVSLYANEQEDGHYAEFVLLVRESYSLTMVQVTGDLEMSKLNFAELMQGFSKDCDTPQGEEDNSGD